MFGWENLECSPSGEPNRSSLSFHKFQVKLKLDTPENFFPFMVIEVIREGLR